MSGQAVWNANAQELYDRLVQKLGSPVGDRGRGQSAYREASKRLARAGVRADDLDIVARDYALDSLRKLGPMPLASFALGGNHMLADVRRLVVVRWANECVECKNECRRGSLAWYRRDDDDKGYLTCGGCEQIDPTWQRADEARRWAIGKDDDPEGLAEAVLAETAPEAKAHVEDSLPTSLFMDSP